MKLIPSTLASVFAAGLISLLSGCAITHQEVKEAYNAKTDAITAAQAAVKTQRPAAANYQKFPGNYLGSNLVATNSGASLPERYRKRDLSKTNAMAMGTLQQAIEGIQSLGLSVRVSQDVANPPTAQAAGAPASGASAPAAAAVVQGINTPKPPVLVPLNITGDLTNYLNQITSQLGVSWDYNPSANEVNIFRMTTRQCTIMDLPGAIDFDDKLSGGGGSSGASGSGTSVQGGSFGSTSNANVVAEAYDPWKLLVAALEIIKSPAGRLATNRATGSVFITDTKEGAERVCNTVASENARMNLQIALDIHEIRVELNDGNSIGLDLNMVFQQLNTITGNPDWTFKFGAPSNLTDASSGSATFNIARPESRLAGSNVAAQALASFGNVVLDKTDTIVTRNRVPGRMQKVKEQVYLASTTPASGSAVSGGGAGVPGLTPGTVTYGSTIAYVPTVGDNNQVTLHLFDTQSDLISINSVSTGSGVTLQQINTPVLSKDKFAQSFTVAHGETLVIVGSESDSLSTNTNAALTGASNNVKRTKTMSVLLVTPHVQTGTGS